MQGTWFGRALREYIDPFGRVLLEAAWACLQDIIIFAGIVYWTVYFGAHIMAYCRMPQAAVAILHPVAAALGGISSIVGYWLAFVGAAILAAVGPLIFFSLKVWGGSVMKHA